MERWLWLAIAVLFAFATIVTARITYVQEQQIRQLQAQVKEIARVQGETIEAQGRAIGELQVRLDEHEDASLESGKIIREWMQITLAWMKAAATKILELENELRQDSAWQGWQTSG